MNIVFFCQSCGARFDVPPSAAGKKGRCKTCGQVMEIPRPAELASMTAMPAMAPVATSTAAVSKGSWIASANSSVALAPLTVDRMPLTVKKQARAKTKWEEDGDSKPYLVAPEPRIRVMTGIGKPASGLKMLWRKELGIIQKVFRWLNETAYLVSVPFLMLIILGVITRNRSLAILGATLVVLLNVGRIVAGLANLIVIPFRDGITQGILFLIPPLTFIYMSNHWKKLRKPTLRIVEPALTIALVVIAFTFLPSLRKAGPVSGDLKDRIVDGAKGLRGEIEGEVSKAKDLDVKTIEDQAGGKLRELQEAVGPESKGSIPKRKTRKPAPSTSNSTSAEDTVSGLLRNVEKQAGDAIKEAQPNP